MISTVPPSSRGTSRGFVALSVLLLLLGTGGVLAGLSLELAEPRTHERSQRALMLVSRSARAATALMAHTSLYPDLYGPGGAGPGHLPCPDTDTAAGQRPTRVGLSRAGPNPPCAARPSVSGTVPAHITLTGFRAGIDSDAASEPTLALRVDADVVNNPLGRVVNSVSFGAGAVEPMAEIGIDQRLPDARPVAITRDQLMPVVERRVIIWIDEQLLPELSRRVPADGSWSQCRDKQPCALDAALPDTASLMEGVTRRRHWFWRNQWDRLVNVSVETSCLQAVASCVWASRGELPVTLRLARALVE